MKKIISLLSISLIGFSIFAYDIVTDMQLKGVVKNVTRTDFSIASKFGEYFRTPSAKFIYLYDSFGKQIETTELTPRDAVSNKIKNTFDSYGNITEQVCFDADGNEIWKIIISYSGGVKSSASGYGKEGILKSKTVYSYIEKKLSEETYYNGSGAIVWKVIYKYNDKNQIETEDEYFGDGYLDEERQFSYTESGKNDTISYFDGNRILKHKDIFRYNSDGILTEIITYTPDNKIKVRKLIKYDETGNIIKITTYNVNKKFGTTLNEMMDMTEFSYSYGSSVGLN